MSHKIHPSLTRASSLPRSATRSASSIPRLMIKNPVMFVTLIGAVLTTVGDLHRARPTAASSSSSPSGCGSPCSSRTSPKPSPKAAARPRPTACARPARTPWPAASRAARKRRSPRPLLEKGDLVVCETGDVIPADGEVIEGIASVDEAAITGESAPVIRESGGDRSAVTGGTRVISDRIVDPDHLGKGQHLPRPHDRDGGGRETPEDAERNRAHHPALRADAHLPARRASR